MEATLPNSSAPEAHPLSRAQKILRTLGWTGLGIFLLVLFTVMKLPEIRLKNYIQGNLSNALANHGMTFAAESASLSVLFGVSYTFKNVTLTPQPPELPIKIDALRLSPAFLPLLTGKLGGHLDLAQGDGRLKASFAFRGNEGSISFNSEKLNLGRLEILSNFAKVKGSATVSGDGSVAGNLSNPQTWNGVLKIDIERLTLDPQSIMNLALPGIGVSEGKLDVSIAKGKAVIKTFTLGKGADDLIATITGDIQLNESLPTSALNLKTRFKFSEKVIKALPLLDTLMSSGKQSDGFFAFNIGGWLNAPAPSPVGGT